MSSLSKSNGTAFPWWERALGYENFKARLNEVIKELAGSKAKS
jgi:hypothetical protein